MKAHRETTLLIALPLLVLSGALLCLLAGGRAEGEPVPVRPVVAVASPARSQPVVTAAQIPLDLGSPASASAPAVDAELVQGSVADSQGNSVAGASVRVRVRANVLDGQGQGLFPVETVSLTNSDALGRFSFPHTQAALYDLVVSADGFATEVLTFQQGQQCTAVLTRPALVKGRISAADGSAVANATVSLLQGAQRTTLTTDAVGRYGFAAAAAGSALLEVSHAQFEPQLVRIPVIVESETVIRDVTLFSGLTLRGGVKDAQGRAVASASVTVYDTMRMLPCGSVVTGTDGAFVMHSLSSGGTYRIAAELGAEAAMLLVRVPSSGAIPAVDLSLAVRWSIEGTICTEQGVAVSGAMINAIAENGAGALSSVSNAAGAFQAADLQGGTSYRLVVVAPGRAMLQLTGITVNKRVVAIELEPAASADGRVVTAVGNTLQGAAVKLSFPDAPFAPIFTLTGVDGRWHLDNLPSGSVWVTIMRAGFENSVCNTTLYSGARMSLQDTTLQALQ